MVRRVGELVTVRVSVVRPERVVTGAPGGAGGEVPDGDRDWNGDGTQGGGGADQVLVPTGFLWRGRLYVVREVVGHWWERRSWWTSAAARAVHGESPGGDAAAGTGRFGPVRERSTGRGSGGGIEGYGAGRVEHPPGPGSRVELEHEREVWRVEASAGRTFGSGVYDLCRDPGGDAPGAGSGGAGGAAGPEPPGTWRLLRVTD